MSDEDFDDEPDIADEAEDEELELDDDVLVDDVLVDDADVEAVVDDVADVVEVAEVVSPAPARGGKAAAAKSGSDAADDDDDVVDLDEEHHPDDIEDPLDVLLKEKTVAERLDEDELDDDLDDGEPDDRGSNRITPRRADEFLCSSCFLVLPLSQLADEKRQLCRDCV
jgi:hypothetical protein